MSMMFQGTHGSLVDVFFLWRSWDGTNAHLVAQANASSSPGAATTTAADSTGVWHHACAVFASSTSRSIYLDGTNKITNTTSITPSSGSITGTRIGDSDADCFDGDLAEVAIWNAALSDAEVASLFVSNGVGVYPTDVKVANLVAYWPVLGSSSPEPDDVGSNDLTLFNSPASSTHLTMQNIGSGGGGGGLVAMMMQNEG